MNNKNKYTSNKNTGYTSKKTHTQNKPKQNNSQSVKPQKQEPQEPKKPSIMSRLGNSIRQKMHERKIYNLGYKSFDLNDSRAMWRGGKVSEPQMSRKYFKKYINLSPRDKAIFDNARLQAERDLEDDYVKISRDIRNGKLKL